MLSYLMTHRGTFVRSSCVCLIVYFTQQMIYICIFCNLKDSTVCPMHYGAVSGWGRAVGVVSSGSSCEGMSWDYFYLLVN